MTFASGTCTTAEAVTLSDAAYTLALMLRQIKQGDATAAATSTGRFTAAQIDTQVSALSAAITAANA